MVEPGDHFSALERETVINSSDGEDVIRIWTAQRRVITHCRKHKEFREVKTGYFGTSEWAEFIIPAPLFRFGVKAKRTMTPEQRAAAGQRLRQSRESSR